MRLRTYQADAWADPLAEKFAQSWIDSRKYSPVRTRLPWLQRRVALKGFQNPNRKSRVLPAACQALPAIRAIRPKISEGAPVVRAVFAFSLSGNSCFCF